MSSELDNAKDCPSIGLDAFAGAHHFTLDSLQMTHAHTIQTHHHLYNSNRAIDLAQLLNPLYDASHTRNRKIAPPDSACLTGTREDVLQELHCWIDSATVRHQRLPGSSVQAAKPICWMYGSFGCGKSAIAQTIAEGYARKGKLAAAFFFFRNSGERSSISRLVSTLAHQISLSIPAAKVLIERAVVADPGLTHAACSLEAQLQHLVFEPLVAILGGTCSPCDSPYLIVTDGLDECADKEGVSDFIDLFTSFFTQNPAIPLRLLITSRVEEHIQTHVEHDVAIIYLYDLSSRSSNADIRHFMEMFFSQARRHSRALMAMGMDWPEEGDMAKLVNYCGESFIFGSTVAKYIIRGSGESDPRTPVQRLALALEANPGIDSVYTEVLSRAQYLPHFRTVVSTLALLGRPLSISAMSIFLNLATYDIIRVLVPLQGIFQVPGRDDLPVTVFHTSLRDYLLDESRSAAFYAAPSHHAYLVHRCMEILFGTEPTTKAECNVYAMIYWAEHLRAALVADNDSFSEDFIKSDSPYNPIDKLRWDRRDLNRRAEGRPVQFALSSSDKMLMLLKQKKLLRTSPFLESGLEPQVILTDVIMSPYPRRWSNHLLTPGELESLHVCSFADIVFGLCTFIEQGRSSGATLSMKRGNGVTIIMDMRCVDKSIRSDWGFTVTNSFDDGDGYRMQD
ncbi:hypothetical protein NMY22_g2767 [Coprinellus aureogranulatus]|nr:hypothetical protein NMY22_g2767 [Coprinellus aureogranulatus]